jgi:UDP-glucuronate 4-epimerase
VSRRILVTGAAGFIGHAVYAALLMRGDQVIGIDNMNEYYDPNLKRARLALLRRHEGFQFALVDISHREKVRELFATASVECVIHLAAQAGVRYSINHPHTYIDSNIEGFINILEGCRHFRIRHLIYASSSSVYGTN